MEAGEPVPPWADADGIIPLTAIPGEPPLIERLRERLAAEHLSEATLSAALDLPLDRWLHTRFAATDALLSEIRTHLGLAVDGAFRAWMRAEREAARALKQSLPKFKREKALVEALERRIGAWSPDRSDLPRFVTALPLLDAWCGEPGRAPPATLEDFVRQESAWRPDINDGVRVNIAPIQRAGLLAADPLAAKDIEPALADRAAWRADERRWVREGKLPRLGWWPEEGA